jgi:Mycothiol maleylpyruvate isomerase N-terminal domain
MNDIAERYERVTAQFTARVRAVPEEARENPSPCEGWTARDVVGHLTEWIPAFFGPYGVESGPCRPSWTTRLAHERPSG